MTSLAPTRLSPLLIAALAALLVAGYFVVRHLQESGTPVAAAQAHAQHAATAAPRITVQASWVCPMHSHIHQDHPGHCPICGMGLVETTPPETPDAAMPQAPAVTPAAPKGTVQASWVCPMHSHIHQDHPGRCPICGMDLVQASDGPAAADAGVHVDAASLQRIGVRLATLEYRTLSRDVQTYGNVALDETSLTTVSPRIDGWIRKLHVSAVGAPVRAGQVLYELYSPDLVQQQREYIELLQRRDQMQESLTQLAGQNAQVLASLARERVRAREKFIHADVSRELLDEIERTRRTIDVVPVHAPRSGFVTRLDVREGSYVTPMTPLLALADTRRVWIDIALYPDQLDWVGDGDTVHVKLPGSAGKPLTGRLVFAGPLADSESRTVRARVVVDNPQGRLRPGLFVDVSIAAGAHTALVAPRSAVIRTGAGDRVMLARGDGHFIPLPVETGLESGELIEITDGLQEGAQVAVNGNFLLDAAASMADARERMQDRP